ncbi:MAG: potassium transporter TrkG [Candidatus Krumholzibacteria bacterium]|nr:potassium transporter TrkG [Candidatus Krumholzibacteria bacterium]
MRRNNSVWRRLSPYQLLLLGYAVITVTCALLLSLPISSAEGTRQPFLDALFLATSGISTTGLTVVDVGSYYSLFGQIVLLVLFQIGGIGYMTFVILMMYFLGIKGSIRTSLVAKESMAGPNLHVLKSFFLSVLAYSIAFELVGAAILAVIWAREYPAGRSMYLGLFHSVSAFCTAGFGLFSDSLMRYRESTLMNATIVILSLAGGIGFFVLKDLTALIVNRFNGRRRFRLTVHTRLVLIVTTIVISTGTVVILLSEHWPAGMGVYDKAMASVFQAVSASTTDGFNTIDIGKMAAASLTIIMLLMYVGASPGSTGGGIKTTTFGLLFILLWARLRRKENNFLGREISERCIYDAIVVGLCCMLVVLADTVILSITEKTSYLQNLFEIFSALGNTGLSTGITSALSSVGKAALIVTMFIGRVGILSIAFAVFSGRREVFFRYPKEDVFVG